MSKTQIRSVQADDRDFLTEEEGYETFISREGYGLNDTNLILDGYAVLSTKQIETPQGDDIALVNNSGELYISDSEEYYRTNGLIVSALSSQTTLKPNRHYLSDTSSGSFNATLPLGSNPGATIRISDVAGSWKTNPLTILSSGSDQIEGSTGITLDKNSSWIQLMWSGVEWKKDDPLSDIEDLRNVSDVTPQDNDILSWDDQEGKWKAIEVTPSTYTYRKVYVAERNSSGSGKLAFGNGSTSTGMGAVITEDCKLVAVGISSAGDATGSWNIVVGATTTVHTTTTSSARVTVDTLSSPVSLTAGTFINAVCTSAGGASHSVTFEVEVESPVAGIRGPQGIQGPAGQSGQDGADGTDGLDGISQVRTGSGAPSNSLGSDGDLYIDNNSKNYYTKQSGSWQLVGSLAVSSSTTAAQVTNLVNTSINSSTAIFSTWDTSSLIVTDGSAFTFSSDGVVVAQGGIYEVYTSLYQEGTSQRTSVGVGFTVDGVDQGPIGASAYIRSSNGHEEGSSSLQQMVSVQAGEKIGVKAFKLAANGTVTAPAGTAIFSIKRII